VAERAPLVTHPGLNHGLVVDEKNGYIYASTCATNRPRQQLVCKHSLHLCVRVRVRVCGTNSSREVWRWHYSPGQRSNLGTAARVIYGIPCCGHLTRTLEMDDEGNLYVR
jgi:hypothetical protein